jgi:tetratricopeptide (TPR) repeat protein
LPHTRPLFLLAWRPPTAEACSARIKVIAMTPRASRLAAALVAALLSIHAMPSTAQVGRYDPTEREARKKHETETSSKFPNAKRESPQLQATKQGGKTLKELVEAYQAKNYADAIAKAEPFAASTDNAYEKAFAYQLAGTAAADSKDMAKAAADFQKAVDANGLDNDQHYVTMYNLAIVQAQLGQYDAALKTLDRYQSESGADPADSAELRGSLLANTKQGGQAAGMFEQAWRKNPSDAKALNNAAALYQQNKQFDKANALLLEAKSKGGLDASGYQALYVGQISAGKDKDALATINEGLSNGKIAQDDKLGNAYTVLAQNAFMAGDMKGAVDLYKKAAPISADGEPALNLARVLMSEGRLAEAKQAAQQALDKGVKNPADAKKILAKKGK